MLLYANERSSERRGRGWRIRLAATLAVLFICMHYLTTFLAQEKVLSDVYEKMSLSSSSVSSPLEMPIGDHDDNNNNSKITVNEPANKHRDDHDDDFNENDDRNDNDDDQVDDVVDYGELGKDNPTIFDQATLLPNPYRFWNTPGNPSWGNNVDAPKIHHVIRTFEDVDTPMDVLSSEGRSCVWDDKDSQWICQNCVANQNKESHCEWPLEPNYENVPVWPRLAWDEPPRSSSSLDPLSSASTRTVVQTMHDNNRIPALQTISCHSSTLEWPCFDLSKCHDDNTLSVHGVGNHASRIVSAADIINHVDSSSTRSFLKPVDDPSEACLFVFGQDTYATLEELAADFDGGTAGQNHLVLNSNRMFEWGVDFPIFDQFNWELAALASQASTDAHVRWGMDMHLPFPDRYRHYRGEGPPDPWEERPILVNFKGKAFDLLQPFAHHRRIVAQFWSRNETNVVVADVCIDPGKDYYDIPEEEYGEILRKSTFVFCPGGRAHGSYRFAETLGAGGIPVVLSAFVVPFAPEVDWSSCVVWASEARIADLPSMLRQFSRKEIAQRRTECWRLFLSAIWGYCPLTSDPMECNHGNKNVLGVSLEVWFHRIRRAKRQRRRRLDLQKSLVAAGRTEQSRRRQHLDFAASS